MPWNTPAHIFIHIHNSILSFKCIILNIPFTWSSQRYARWSNYNIYETILRRTHSVFICRPTRRPCSGGCGGSGRRRNRQVRSVLKQHWKPQKRAPLGFSGSPCSAVLGAASCRFLRHSCWGSRKRQKHAVVLLLLLLLKPSGGEVSDPCVSAVYSECEAGNLFCVNKKNY